MLTKFESYPFLEIARTYNVDYGDVLNFAVLVAEWHRNERHRARETFALSEKLGRDAALAVQAMVRKPVHERRGTPRATQA
jgi:hypothetical protein